MKHEFEEFGYTIIRGFISEQTARTINELSINDAAMTGNGHAVLDGDGRESRLTLWYEPGNEVFGRLSCSDQMFKL